MNLLPTLPQFNIPANSNMSMSYMVPANSHIGMVTAAALPAANAMNFSNTTYTAATNQAALQHLTHPRPANTNILLKSSSHARSIETGTTPSTDAVTTAIASSALLASGCSGAMDVLGPISALALIALSGSIIWEKITHYRETTIDTRALQGAEAVFMKQFLGKSARQVFRKKEQDEAIENLSREVDNFVDQQDSLSDNFFAVIEQLASQMFRRYKKLAFPTNRTSYRLKEAKLAAFLRNPTILKDKRIIGTIHSMSYFTGSFASSDFGLDRLEQSVTTEEFVKVAQRIFGLQSIWFVHPNMFVRPLLLGYLSMKIKDISKKEPEKTRNVRLMLLEMLNRMDYGTYHKNAVEFNVISSFWNETENRWDEGDVKFLKSVLDDPSASPYLKKEISKIFGGYYKRWFGDNA